MTPKLTPTTNDLLAQKSDGQFPPQQPMHITPPHEPLPHEQWQPGGFYQVSHPASGPVVLQPTPKREKKIAIIGTAPSSRNLAPFKDLSWIIWGCSPGNAMTAALPRCDAWFEVHGKALLWPQDAHYGPQYIEWMKTLTCPVYLLPNHHTDPDQTPIVPNARIIPMWELVAEFGPYDFTSSFTWMMAMAIHEGATQVKLYGIDMASRDEYIQQRAGAYGFFKEAWRRGIDVDAPNESDIMQPPPLYGYSAVGPMGRKALARTDELKGRLGPMEQQFNAARDNINYLKGALEDNDYFNAIHGGAQDNNSHFAYRDRLLQKARGEAAPVGLQLPSQG